MLTAKDPRAVSAEARSAFLAGGTDGHSTTALRVKALTERHHLHSRRAAMFAGMIWGGQHGC